MPIVSEVQIIPVKAQNGLLAFASCLINKNLYISSIAIHSKLRGGYRLTYPTKKVAHRDINIFHPTTKELSKVIEEAIINKYIKLISQ